MTSLIELTPDDLPMCPKHGIRIVTDFIVDGHGLEYERGPCPLCGRTYTFVTTPEDNEVQS